MRGAWQRLAGFLALTVVALIVVGIGACSVAAKPVELKTDDDKTLYALGLSFGGNIASYGLTAEEAAVVAAGLVDAVTGQKPQVDLQTYGPKIKDLMTGKMTKKAGAEKEKGKAFLEQAAKEKGAVKADDGMIYVETQKGTGPSPAETDTVKVSYSGKLTDGTEFDASAKHGGPVTFPLNGVIKCWTEGVQKMAVGGKAKLVCPSEIAYGDNGHPPVIPPGATLVFEIELLDIVKK